MLELGRGPSPPWRLGITANTERRTVNAQSRKTQQRAKSEELSVRSRAEGAAGGAPALQALSRVKGCASRGGESGVEHDHEHEHKEENLNSERVLSSAASANPDLYTPGFGFFSLFGSDPAASLPNFFNNRCKVSRSFFERTRMAFSIAAACSRKPRMISARPFPVSST